MGIEKPEFINYVKSGAHAERRPEQQNFWYLRLASLLRQAYTTPKIAYVMFYGYLTGIVILVFVASSQETLEAVAS